MRLVSVVAILGVMLTGCGSGSPSAPTAQTPIDVRVGDLTNPKLGPLLPPPPGVTGMLSGNFGASIWDGSRWVDLGIPQAITLGLQIPVYSGGPTTVHGEQRAPIGSYDRVKLILQGVTAHVASGSRVGGITLSSDATIKIGGSDNYLEVTYPVRFSLGDDPSVRRVVVFQLFSAGWLTTSAVQSGQVEDEAMHVQATTSVEAR